MDDRDLERDKIDDPRFQISPEELEKRGIKDFQLHYAIDTLRNTRLAQTMTRPAGAKPASQRR